MHPFYTSETGQAAHSSLEQRYFGEDTVLSGVDRHAVHQRLPQNNNYLIWPLVYLSYYLLVCIC